VFSGKTELPAYIRVTQADGKQAWSSPIYLITWRRCWSLVGVKTWDYRTAPLIAASPRSADITRAKWRLVGQCQLDAWGRVSFLTAPVSIPRRIDDSNYSLAAGMDVDVPDFDDLLTAPSITLEADQEHVNEYLHAPRPRPRLPFALRALIDEIPIGDR
jgi:hypothetical protein